MDELFEQLPENLTELSVEELNDLLARFKASARAVRDKEIDFNELGMSAEDVVKAFQDGVVAIKQIEQELADRTAGEEAFDAALADAAADVNLSDDDIVAVADESGVEDDPGVEEFSASVDEEDAEEPEESDEEDVEEALVAAAANTRLALPSVPKTYMPAPSSDDRAAFVASAGIPGYAEGRKLDGIEVAEAIIAKRRQFTSTPAGVSEDVVVARLDYRDLFPQEQVLDGNNDDEKIQAVVGREAMGIDPMTGNEALVASGGICAAPTPMYDVAGLGVAARPVRGALPSFMAARGGILHAGAVTIADVDSSATGIVTSAEDALGGTYGAKSCYAVTCPEYTETTIQAIYQCLQFGNMNSRTWPELVDRWVSETRAAHARLAETALLDGIAAASTAVTRAAQYGALSTIIAGVLQSAAGMRSRHRSDPNMRLRALLPAWLPDLLLNDLGNTQFNRFDFTREGITALLRRYGIEPTFYLDGATGAGQVFGAQAAGALNAFPTSVVGYLYPEGTFLYLDGGTLDLGIVRDSTLNASNDYQLFMEVFENVAFVGVESLALTWTVCPSGEVAVPTDNLITC